MDKVELAKNLTDKIVAKINENYKDFQAFNVFGEENGLYLETSQIANDEGYASVIIFEKVPDGVYEHMTVMGNPETNEIAVMFSTVNPIPAVYVMGVFAALQKVFSEYSLVTSEDYYRDPDGNVNLYGRDAYRAMIEKIKNSEF